MGSMVKVWAAEGTVSHVLRPKRLVKLEGSPDRDAWVLMHGCPRSAALDSERSALSWKTEIMRLGKTNRNIRCSVKEPEFREASEY